MRFVRSAVVAVAACAVLLLAGLKGSSATQEGQARQHSTGIRPTPVPSPAAHGASLPRLHASSRGVLLSWVERAGSRATLKFAERTTAGWSPARTVASGDDWFVNWADVPSVIRFSDGTLAAHWLRRSGSGTYAYDVRLAWSRDDGRTWSAAFSPHDDGTQTEHGFASLLELPGASLGVAWLDGRAMAMQAAHGSGGHAGGDMALRFADYSKAWTRVSDVPLDLRVCECCPTSAAMTAEGPVVAFRNRDDREVRDIHVSRRVGGAWTVPVAVHADGWTLPACPVNGPAIAAHARQVVLTWFTAKDDQPRVWAAFSSDAARSFGPPIRVDDVASLGRAGIVLLDDGSALVSHIEFSGQRSEFRVRRVAADGTRLPAVTVSSIGSGRASGYPRIAVYRGELVMAWTEPAGNSSVVRTAMASVE